MQIFDHTFPQLNRPFAVSFGKFDGVHMGHRHILDTLAEEARKHSALSVVYSFEPRNGSSLLTTTGEKQVLFEDMGIDALVMVELGGELMAMEPEAFIMRLMSCGELKAVAVGEDFRFGRCAAGDAALLAVLGKQNGFDVHVIERVRMDGEIVSSTLIRECVKSGDVERAARLLGREYSFTGDVVFGRQLGRQLGFSTANLLPQPCKVLPAFGVYAAYVYAEDKVWPAMVNIGVKPTVDGRELLIESHLIGYEGDLYGKRIEVRLVRKTRDELRFAGLNELKAQLTLDRQLIMDSFSSH